MPSASFIDCQFIYSCLLDYNLCAVHDVNAAWQCIHLVGILGLEHLDAVCVVDRPTVLAVCYYILDGGVVHYGIFECDALLN